MCEEELRRHHRSTIIMKDIDLIVFLCNNAQEPEVIKDNDFHAYVFL